MVQEGRVEGPADRLIAPEAEGNVGHPPADLGAGALLLDSCRGINEVHRVVVVLRHARADGKHVGIKDDVLWVKAHLVDENVEGTLANAHLDI